MVGYPDDRDDLVRAFPDLRALVEAGRLRFVIGRDFLRLVMCDSPAAGQPGGAVGAEQLGWLGEMLCVCAYPAVVFVRPKVECQ